MREIEAYSTEVPVNIKGTETTMSLTRRGEVWTLSGDGLAAVARSSTDVFVSALGIIDGKKAVRRWTENMEGGEENGREIG